VFKAREDLCELYPRLLSYSTLCIGAREVSRPTCLEAQCRPRTARKFEFSLVHQTVQSEP
jgi:hypothetical protein